ncbi:unnamed protein product [Peniophora sp. CBMAI 1063]|nr:unnamed protein product [Peniophora sp. CBMAI 1063]
MSFSGTPLGQGRRLDHSTFLNKRNPLPAPRLAQQQASTATTTTTTNKPPSSPSRAAEPNVPTSYSYGAPTATTRSPPKLNKSNTSLPDGVDVSADAPALIRFARLKHRESATASNPQDPAWVVQDTSVNIANALTIAANTSSEMDHSYTQRVPRSTSVDYEKETQHTRQLPIRAKPPSSRGSQTQRPATKAPSLQFVPGSDDEENAQEMAKRKERGKSPLVALGESIAETAKRTAFYMRPSSQSQTQQNGNGNGHTQDESYDYAAEEREFQQSQPQARRVRRANIPVDAKAYKPTESDLESESEEDSDSGKPRRRKKKKGEAGGLLTGLPTVGYGGKRRKRKSMGGKEDSLATLAEEDDGEIVEKIGETLDMQRAGSVQAPPLIIRPASRPPSLPPAPPQPQPFESSLDSIDESQPPLISDDSFNSHQRAPSLPRRVPKNPKPKRSARSLGALTGRAVNVVLRLILFALSESLRALGRALGTVFDATIRKPAKLLGSTNFTPFIQIASVALIGYLFYSGLRSVNLGHLFSPSTPAPVYTPPDVPAASIAELGARLQALENALGKLSFEAAHERARLDAHADVSSKLESLRMELSRVDGDRAAERAQASQIVQSVRKEVEGLRRDVEVKGQEWSKERDGRSKEELDRLEKARKAEAERVKALEERLGGVEGGLKEALEVVRKPVVPVNDKSHAPAWWTKLSTSTGKPLSIKGNNGEDVTVLIGALVDEAVLRTQKDGLARADFALHSGGARVIPSLTSPTLDAPPRGLREALHGLLTGSGAPVGRPPVYALHHDTSAGMCWPFGGSHGTLGVALARPAFIDAISIDHLARELAWDVRSAPRGMEVWGLVEGRENLEKVGVWEMGRAMRRAACASGESAPNSPECAQVQDEESEEEYPPELPKSAKYVRIAAFEYDARQGRPVQTFDIDEGVKALGVDFGVVVLRVLGNWGAEYTCLYRVRVHGTMLGAEGGALDALD